MTSDNTLQHSWRAQALDRCVKCGMCLPECPTYRLSADENRSPRGRLAIMEGLLSGRLAGDRGTLRHLDSCLGCRRCERVCPSAVEFGRLMDDQRREYLTLSRKVAARLLSRPRLQELSCRLGQLVPEWLSRPFDRLHAAHRVARSVPLSTARLAAHRRGAVPAGISRVGLFAGCSGRTLLAPALDAADHLLQQLGYRVVHADRETCCGALSAHAGDSAGARADESATRAAFPADIDTFVSLASGCGTHIDGYHPRPAHQDILQFLVGAGRLAHHVFDPLPERVALHTPCSVENVYRGRAWAATALGAIPSLELLAVGEPGQCCGAAGDFMLRHPHDAARLRTPLLDAFVQTGATILLTSNVGCAVHIATGLKERGATATIMHPVELLARQLQPHD